MVDGSKASKCTLDFSALNFSFLISVHVVQSYAVSDNIKEMITTLPEYHGGGGHKCLCDAYNQMGQKTSNTVFCGHCWLGLSRTLLPSFMNSG